VSRRARLALDEPAASRGTGQLRDVPALEAGVVSELAVAGLQSRKLVASMGDAERPGGPVDGYSPFHQ